MAVTIQNAELIQKMAKYKIYDQTGQAAAFDKVLGQLPEVLKEGKDQAALEAEVLKAIDSVLGSTAGGSSAPSNPTTVQKTTSTAQKSEKYVPTSDDRKVAATAMRGLMEAGIHAASQAEVSAILTSKPAITDRLGDVKEMTVSSTMKADAFRSKYEKDLEDTPENKANFQKMIALLTQAETGVATTPIYVNPNARPVVAGYEITEGNGAVTTAKKDKLPFAALLISKYAGRIVTRADGSGLGAIVMTYSPKTSNATKTKTVDGENSVIARVKGIAEYFKKNPTGKPTYDTVSGKTTSVNVKSELSIRVLSTSADAATPKYRTIRLSGKVDNIADLERKGEYKDTFGEISQGLMGVQTVTAIDNSNRSDALAANANALAVVAQMLKQDASFTFEGADDLKKTLKTVESKLNTESDEVAD